MNIWTTCSICNGRAWADELVGSRCVPFLEGKLRLVHVECRRAIAEADAVDRRQAREFDSFTSATLTTLDRLREQARRAQQARRAALLDF